MPTTPFSQTFAELLADRARLTAAILAGAMLVLAAWSWWAVRAHVTLYEVSTSARIEVDAAITPIQSSLTGRVVRANLHVGQVVHSGDVLVEIDAVPEELALRQQQVRVDSVEPQLTNLRAQIAAEVRARASIFRPSGGWLISLLAAATPGIARG